MDEFDSIAKKRDDEGDIGELKRLVTVLLQEVDDWPSTSLLIAATNHGELLDSAVWRRFDDVLQFYPPSADERAEMLTTLFGGESDAVQSWMPLLVDLWAGRSFSDVTRAVQWMRRRSTTSKLPIVEVLTDWIKHDLRQGAVDQRKRAAALLSEVGFSDRKISEVAGISRDTIRKSRVANLSKRPKKGITHA